VINEDWRRALDATEAELVSCATQVLGCIERQAAQQVAKPPDGL